jgi:hypothetical protein
MFLVFGDLVFAVAVAVRLLVSTSNDFCDRKNGNYCSLDDAIGM